MTHYCNHIMIVFDQLSEGGFILAVFNIHDLLTIFGTGDQLISVCHKPASGLSRYNQLPTRFINAKRYDFFIVAKINHQSHWLTMTTSTRKLICGKGIKPTIARKQKNFIRCLTMEREFSFVALFKFNLVINGHMAFHGPGPNHF